MPISDAAAPSALRKYPTSATSTSTRMPNSHTDATRPRRAGTGSCGMGAAGAGAGGIRAPAPRRGCASGGGELHRGAAAGCTSHRQPKTSWPARRRRRAGSVGGCASPTSEPGGGGDPVLAVIQDDEAIPVPALFDGGPADLQTLIDGRRRDARARARGARACRAATCRGIRSPTPRSPPPSTLPRSSSRSA